MERYLKALQELTGDTGFSREPVRRFRSGSYTSDDAYDTPDSIATEGDSFYSPETGSVIEVVISDPEDEPTVGAPQDDPTSERGSGGEGSDGTETVFPDRPSLPEGFDREAYLQANPDVAAAGVDPARHYLEYGRNEGRSLAPAPAPAPAPPAGFDGAAYLRANPDVAAAGLDPLYHYETYGRAEGRRLRPATPSAPSTPKKPKTLTKKDINRTLDKAIDDFNDLVDVFSPAKKSVTLSDGTVTSADGYSSVQESAIANAVNAYRSNPMVARSTTLDPTKQENIDQLVTRLEKMSIAQIENFTTQMGGTVNTKAAPYSFAEPATEDDEVVAFGSKSFDDENRELFDQSKEEPEAPSVAATLTPKGVGLGMPITELTEGADYSIGDDGNMTLYESGAEKVQAYNDALKGKDNKYGITQDEALSIQRQGDIMGLPTVQVNLKSSTFSFVPGKSAAEDEGAKGSTDQKEGTPEDTSSGSLRGGSGRIGESTKKIPGVDTGDKSIYDNKVAEPMRPPEDPDWFAPEYSEDPNATIPSTPEEQDPSGLGIPEDPGGIGIIPGQPSIIGPGGDDLIGFEYDYPEYPPSDDVPEDRGSPITPPSTEPGKGPGEGDEGVGPGGGGPDGPGEGPGVGPGIQSPSTGVQDSGGDAVQTAPVDNVDLPYDFGESLTYDPGLNLQYRTPQVDRAYDFMRDFGRYTLSEGIADDYARKAETSKMSLPYTPEYMEPISMMDEARQAELLPLIGQRFEPGLGEFDYNLTKDPLESAQEIIDALEAEEKAKAFTFEDLLPPDYNDLDSWLDFYRNQGVSSGASSPAGSITND